MRFCAGAGLPLAAALIALVEETPPPGEWVAIRLPEVVALMGWGLVTLIACGITGSITLVLGATWDTLRGDRLDGPSELRARGAFPRLRHAEVMRHAAARLARFCAGAGLTRLMRFLVGGLLAVSLLFHWGEELLPTHDTAAACDCVALLVFAGVGLIVGGVGELFDASRERLAPSRPTEF